MHSENRPPAFYREIKAHHRDISDDALTEEIKEKYPKEKSLRLELCESKYYADFMSEFQPSTDGIKILDVGVGHGLTSVYLASIGYDVTAAEPSPFNCRYTLLLAKVQGVTLKVSNTTGEEMGDILNPCSFDIVHFHAALHHCDHPVEALKQAYRLLSHGGEVRLVCEPCLPVYRSKQWFNRMLLEHPEKIGHYGGNEHIYRIKEYVEMLKQAGFRDVREDIGPMLYEVRYNDKESNVMKAAKHLFSGAIKLCGKCGIVPAIKPILDRLSLGTRIFSGKKEG